MLWVKNHKPFVHTSYYCRILTQVNNADINNYNIIMVFFSCFFFIINLYNKLNDTSIFFPTK